MSELHLTWQQEAFALIEGMLIGKTNLVEGCRALVGLHMPESVRHSQPFLTIRGFESETDALPIGDVRERWDAEALRRKDAEMADYIDTCGAVIRSALEDLRVLVESHV